MDEFVASANNMQVVSTFVVGATFGIFLCIANSWSSFLQVVATVLMPEDNGRVIIFREFLYASLTTFLCLSLLMCLVKCHNCVKQVKAIKIKPVRKIIIQKRI